MGASITLAGESLIAQKHASQAGLTVARFIFANVPGLDPSGPVDRAAPKPSASNIVYTYPLPGDNAGYVNPNQIVYSAQIGSDVGDWDFNWIGLETTENVLLAVAYVPVQQKRKNIPPLQIGNNLTRNFLLAFDGAQALTGLTIDAKTWQHDFTVRLAGIDERQRLSDRDVYGRACFLGTALQLQKVNGAYQLNVGRAWLEGIRVKRLEVLPVVPPSFPTTAWIDVALQREFNDVITSWSVVFGAGKVDYIDTNGVQHFCIPIAELPDSNTITDLRAVEPINGPLIQHFAARTGDYEGLRARATTKSDVGLGNLPNAKSDDPAINDSEILATTKMVRAAVDQAISEQDNKASVLYTTTGAITLSGLAIQSGGDWSLALPENARVLVRNQADASKNGLYAASSNAWTRTKDADTSAKVTPNLTVSIEKGIVHQDTVWHLTTDGPITLGTTALTFEVLVGNVNSGGGTFDRVTVNSRGQVIAGTRPKVTTLGANTTLTADHRGIVLIDAGTASRFITLPLTSDVGIIDILVRRVDGSGNLAIVNTQGGDKIRFHTHLNNVGYPHLFLMGSGDWWHLRSDGAGGWLPLGRLDASPLGSLVMTTTTVIQPGGFGIPNGTVMVRTDYPWLLDHAIASGMLTSEANWPSYNGYFSAGDGASTFRIPDVRGNFARWLDEGKGIDPSRAAGTVQAYNTNMAAGQLAGSLTGTVNLANGPYVSGSIVAIAGPVVGNSGETRPRNIAYAGRIKLI